MAQVRFIGCLHLGHKWMAEHRGWKSVDDFHEHLINTWNSIVHKNDVTYILGDITMETAEFYPILAKLNGRKKVILGNHDKGKDIPELLKYVEEVAGMTHYKGYWLTHEPVHPQELTFVKGNIHCHIHEQALPEVHIKVNYWDCEKEFTVGASKGYMNVDADILNYEPKTIEELKQFYNIKEDEETT